MPVATIAFLSRLGNVLPNDGFIPFPPSNVYSIALEPINIGKLDIVVAQPLRYGLSKLFSLASLTTAPPSDIDSGKAVIAPFNANSADFLIIGFVVL